MPTAPLSIELKTESLARAYKAAKDHFGMGHVMIAKRSDYVSLVAKLPRRNDTTVELIVGYIRAGKGTVWCARYNAKASVADQAAHLNRVVTETFAAADAAVAKI